MSNRKGVLVELKFQQEAIARKLKTSVPTYPMRYDVVVDNGKSLYRVQIKSAYGSRKIGKATECRVALMGGDKKTKYAKNEVDFFAIYLAEWDVWYVLPATKVDGIRYLTLYPEGDSKYSVYEDAWGLLNE
jgi:hypothetical protein